MGAEAAGLGTGGLGGGAWAEGAVCGLPVGGGPRNAAGSVRRSTRLVSSSVQGVLERAKARKASLSGGACEGSGWSLQPVEGPVEVDRVWNGAESLAAVKVRIKSARCGVVLTALEAGELAGFDVPA